MYIFGRGEPLLTPDMQKILSIVRKTEDTQLLTGALMALSTSKFLRSAGADLVSKMMRADISDEASPVYIFGKKSTSRYHEEDKNRKILKNLAHTIINNPTEYNFRAVSNAASWLAENFQVKASPILFEEPSLGLHV